MKSALLILAIVGCVSAQFTTTAQTAILKLHNDLRSKIAKGTYTAKGTLEPAAANMRKMKWDPAVATSAQNFANTCPSGHSGAQGLGENMYWAWSTQAPTSLDSFGTDASKSWEKEFQDYGWKSILLDWATFNTGIGHATAMAWANTNLIGCGAKYCGKDSNGWHRVTVVCQYKSQGNIINTNIYQKGNTCSACPSGSTCEVASGLCV